ncbi:MAG: sigma-54-dependent Fis family transcriptional regulator [Nitrospirales bacterium]|nr:sigma-54-dependent Fis family transcriptional regulator [Nitrospirales bacterium]
MRSAVKRKVLVVDDDGDVRAMLLGVLKDEGFFTTEAIDGAGAVELFRDVLPDAVLLDLNMPSMGGIETLHEIKRIARNVPVIILTGFGDIPTAVEAIKSGAYDFCVKPPDFNKLIITLRRAIEMKELEEEVKRAHTALELSQEGIFGKSGAMRKVIQQINQVAGTDFSVIIQGETGTGKSYIAGVLHSMSKRASNPFVRVDIGLIPDPLAESELFGYRKGAFTGADRNKFGYFESARGGTVFVDELENMSPYMQSKLLTAIEKKEIYPLGSTNLVNIDVRFIAATNKDLKSSVGKGLFREDLFYRIGEFIITLPPLRERREDIPFFTQKFFLEACDELQKQIRGISDGALALLMQHAWYGNIRELKNVIRRAVLLANTDMIKPVHLDLTAGCRPEEEAPVVPLSLKDSVRELERTRIQEALVRTRGNKTKAAEILRISYKNMSDKIREYGIE